MFTSNVTIHYILVYRIHTFISYYIIYYYYQFMQLSGKRFLEELNIIKSLHRSSGLGYVGCIIIYVFVYIC